MAGEIIWEPDGERVEQANLTAYRRWLTETRGLSFDGYLPLWRWSVDQLEEFWSSLWEYFDIAARGAAEPVLATSAMPGATWFPGTALNFAGHLLRHADPGRPALISATERGIVEEVGWAELERRAGALRRTLVEAGVERGDRVVAYLPNSVSAVVGVIACASLGAIWSACAPDFATAGVASRFAQLAPKVLLSCDGYVFNGREHARTAEVEAILAALPTVELAVHERRLDPSGPLPAGRRTVAWEDAVAGEAPLTFDDVPFDHPLWVLFSSGTTGRPKGIVHSHGGILLEQLKVHAFHGDLTDADRFMFVTSTTWVVWNNLVAGLLVGATLVLYDGSPLYPDAEALWRIVAEQRVSALGVGAAFLQGCAKKGLRPGERHDLAALKTVFSTGSPLPDAGYEWVRDALGPRVWINSNSGGTDVCTAFVGGTPTLPVIKGRMQVPLLGVAAAAFDEDGRPVVGELGELVVTKPMPSMPVRFWDDPGGERYRSTYFDMFPGIWRQGDFIAFDADGSSVISGRSDSTLNRRGIRIGTAEIYGVVEAVAGVREALVIGVELPDGDYYMPLFLALDPGTELDAELTGRIEAAIVGALSPRHVPEELIAVAGVPHTRTGKKLEVPVKRLYQGAAIEQVCTPAAVDDIALVEDYDQLAKAFLARRRAGAAAP
jgi:acetoacetyl-CoA synthetase